MAHVQFKYEKKIASQQTKFYALEDRKKVCGLIFTPMIVGISDNIKLKKKEEQRSSTKIAILEFNIRKRHS